MHDFSYANKKYLILKFMNIFTLLVGELII